MIRALLTNKTAKERANIKGVEIAKIKSLPRTKRKNFDIEIVEIKPIAGGVEVFARAWNSQGQIGFGIDGTVDIERFRIFNPPILVDDPNGSVIREWIEKTPEGVSVQKTRRLREDTQEAVLQVIEHNLSVMKNIHTGERIIRGKIGNTTSTFYPDGNPESTTVDGSIEIVNLTSSGFSATRDATNGTHMRDSGVDSQVNRARSPYTWVRGASYTEMGRSYVLFDTASVPDTDTISSATLSLYVTAIDDGVDDANGFIAIVTSTPASNTALALGDWSQIGSIRQHETSEDKDITNITTSAYSDWAFNSTGIGNVSQTGVSKFGVRQGHDLTNTNPGTSPISGILFSMADETGTTQDPKLVVEHSVAASTNSNFFQFM